MPLTRMVSPVTPKLALPSGYGYPTGPSPANRAVFQQFLSRAAIVSTKR